MNVSTGLWDVEVKISCGFDVYKKISQGADEERTKVYNIGASSLINLFRSEAFCNERNLS